MKNLLLLGDSIRMGYDSFVQEKLAGRMNVYFAEDNGRFAQYTLRMVSDWKGKLSLPEIDVVHWNNGLWDVLHLNANSSGSDGEAEGDTISPENVPAEYHFDKDPLTPPDMYRYMLGRVLTRIRQLFPKTEVIFATTTPVIEEQASWAYRSNAEIDAYNRIAREVLVPRGVRINELGEFAKRECSDLHRDWT
ncbi:MAG: SGNH/GDSL hydrolase family protein, partial [Lentisphaeria bacterium]|nr:SGNH/GDSL hydrolase family protein [Lentisphaeria bacterium]